MNPDASALALASTEVDVASIEPGQSITVVWRGKPVVVRHRTEEGDEGGAGRHARRPQGSDRAQRQSRSECARDRREPRPARQGAVARHGAVCTHLGCVPLGQQGDYGGWFCPCHGSQYDTAGRIRKGPAPENMAIPPYAFTADTKIRIG